MIAAVLAGGYSTRMGEDKASLFYREQTFLECGISMLKNLSVSLEEVVVSCRRDAPYTLAVPMCFDLYENCGPMGGLRTVLEQYNQPVLCIPVDTPLLQETLLEDLYAIYETRQKMQDTSVCFVYKNMYTQKIESLVGIYTPQCIPYFEKAMLRQRYSMVQAIPKSVQCIIAYNGAPRAFSNINTKEEYAELQ